MEEHYAEDDEILPQIMLPVPCPIRIDITDTCVRLFVGQRDWEWKRGCPDVLASGTVLPSVEDLRDDDSEQGD